MRIFDSRPDESTCWVPADSVKEAMEHQGRQTCAWISARSSSQSAGDKFLRKKCALRWIKRPCADTKCEDSHVIIAQFVVRCDRRQGRGRLDHANSGCMKSGQRVNQNVTWLWVIHVSSFALMHPLSLLFWKFTSWDQFGVFFFLQTKCELTPTF